MLVPERFLMFLLATSIILGDRGAFSALTATEIRSVDLAVKSNDAHYSAGSHRENATASQIGVVAHPSRRKR
ncbi:hypothetical protein AAVH_14744, partial [Aphelenchoides avenae]